MVVALRNLVRILPVVALLATAMPSGAAQPTLSIRSDADLRYGSFVIFSNGSRTVSATGAITDMGVVPAGREPSGPATFTVQYDRGNNGKKLLDLVIEVQLLSVPPVAASGITASLHSFETDLPGYARIMPGSIMTIAINGCVTRICARSFRVGARLDVNRSWGGGRVNVPLPMNAVLVSAR